MHAHIHIKTHFSWGERVTCPWIYSFSCRCIYWLSLSVVSSVVLMFSFFKIQKMIFKLLLLLACVMESCCCCRCCCADVVLWWCMWCLIKYWSYKCKLIIKSIIIHLSLPFFLSFPCCFGQSFLNINMIGWYESETTNHLQWIWRNSASVQLTVELANQHSQQTLPVPLSGMSFRSHRQEAGWSMDFVVLHSHWPRALQNLWKDYRIQLCIKMIEGYTVVKAEYP